MIRTRTAAALLAAATLTLACGRNGGTRNGKTDSPAPATPDTLTGVVLVTGADPLTRVEIRTATGRVRLLGPVADSLRSVSRAEVAVVGRREAGGFRVRMFRVLRVGDIPVTDGLLRLDGDAAVLVTPGGERVRFGTAPPALRSLAGRRVWIASPPGSAPSSWGVVGPR